MMVLKRPLVMAVDLDGVISQQFWGKYQGHNVIGPPIKGAVEYMNKLHAEGWLIIIFTSRPSTLQNHVESYLRAWGIPFDAVNKNTNDWFNDSLESKIYANVYLDDKSIEQVGKNWNWKKTYRQIKRKFRHHYGRKK